MAFRCGPFREWEIAFAVSRFGLPFDIAIARLVTEHFSLFCRHYSFLRKKTITVDSDFLSYFSFDHHYG